MTSATEHCPVKQMTQGGEAQLRGRRGARLLQLLDTGGETHALDRPDLRHAARASQSKNLTATRT